MSIPRFISTALLTTGLFIVLCLSAFSTSAAILSGSITLPPGQIASNESAQFVISTQPNLGVQGTVSILSSQSSASFSLDLPAGASYRVRFDCVTGCADLDVTTAGFWRETPAAVVGLEGSATAYLSAENQQVDIQLETADTFSGIIRLPEGFVATGEESLIATVTSAVFGEAAVFRQTINTQAGDTSRPFTIGVPPNETGGGWNFDVQCLNCDADIASQLHFPTSAQGDPTSLDVNFRFFYLRNRDNRDMELTFISNVTPSDTTAIVTAPILFLLLD